MLAAILFVPVRYRVEGSYGEETNASFCIHWLCHIVQLKKKNQDAKIRFTVFGIPIRKKQEKKHRKTKPQKEKSTESSVTKQLEPVAKESMDGESVKQKAPAHQKSETKRKKKEKRKKRFSFSGISSIIKFVREQATKDTIRMLKGEAVLTLKHILPRKVTGYVRFGTGDPASTGIILGIVSLFPFSYQKGVTIVPDFEEAVCEARGKAKGRVRVFPLLRIIWRVYRNQELRKLIKRYDQLKEAI